MSIDNSYTELDKIIVLLNTHSMQLLTLEQIQDGLVNRNIDSGVIKAISISCESIADTIIEDVDYRLPPPAAGDITDAASKEEVIKETMEGIGSVIAAILRQISYIINWIVSVFKAIFSTKTTDNKYTTKEIKTAFKEFEKYVKDNLGDLTVKEINDTYDVRCGDEELERFIKSVLTICSTNVVPGEKFSPKNFELNVRNLTLNEDGFLDFIGYFADTTSDIIKNAEIDYSTLKISGKLLYDVLSEPVVGTNVSKDITILTSAPVNSGIVSFVKADIEQIDGEKYIKSLKFEKNTDTLNSRGISSEFMSDLNGNGDKALIDMFSDFINVYDKLFDNYKKRHEETFKPINAKLEELAKDAKRLKKSVAVAKKGKSGVSDQDAVKASAAVAQLVKNIAIIGNFVQSQIKGAYNAAQSNYDSIAGKLNNGVWNEKYKI